MCCLWPWIGCRGLCLSDGEPVGLVAVVSTLDTLPAVSLWPWSRSDGLPVDWLPWWSVTSTPCRRLKLTPCFVVVKLHTL